MAKPHLKVVSPTTANRTVTPKRRRNGDLRTREYLTEHEVERLIAVAKRNRHGHRDTTMVLVAYRHGLRVAELVDLRWDQVDFKTATLHARRVKQIRPAPIRSSATNCARCGGCSATRTSRHTCSHRNAMRRLAPPGLPAWSNAQASRQSSALRFTRTCCATPAATPWRTGATIRERSKPTSDTKISSTRCATPSCRRRGSRTFGGE